MTGKILNSLPIVFLSCFSCAAQNPSCRGASCEEADVSSLLQVSLEPAIVAKATQTAEFDVKPAPTTDLPKDAKEWSGLVIDVGLVSTGSCSMVKAFRDLGAQTRHVAVDNEELVEAGMKVQNVTMHSIKKPPETDQEEKVDGKNVIHFVREKLWTNRNSKLGIEAAEGNQVDKCKYIEDIARQGWNFAADVPFSFPTTFSCVNRFNAIAHLAGKPRIKLVASQRTRKHWVDSMVLHQWKGGPTFRKVWGMPHTPLSKGLDADQPNLTAAQYGSIWDRHHALVKKYKVAEVFLEVPDSKKWEALCSVLKDMNSTIYTKCVKHAKTHKYPFWVPKFQSTPRGYDANILWQHWTTELGVPPAAAK